MFGQSSSWLLRRPNALVGLGLLGLVFTIAIVGAIWGFVDGCIGGAILAWLYNKLGSTPAAG